MDSKFVGLTIVLIVIAISLYFIYEELAAIKKRKAFYEKMREEEKERERLTKVGFWYHTKLTINHAIVKGLSKSSKMISNSDDLKNLQIKLIRASTIPFKPNSVIIEETVTVHAVEQKYEYNLIFRKEVNKKTIYMTVEDSRIEICAVITKRRGRKRKS